MSTQVLTTLPGGVYPSEPRLSSHGEEPFFQQVMVNLPGDVYRRAERLAQMTSREVADVLADTLTSLLPSLHSPLESFRPVAELSDKEVLDLTELQMKPFQDRRLSLLLDRQQAGTITETERPELWVLMQLYEEGLLRKAQALHEAVRRGLREPLDPYCCYRSA